MKSPDSVVAIDSNPDMHASHLDGTGCEVGLFYEITADGSSGSGDLPPLR